MRPRDPLRLLPPSGGGSRPTGTGQADHADFDPARLIQARRLAALTRRAVAAEVGVDPVMVGQWEAGTVSPRPDQLTRLGQSLGVPAGFFEPGRPHARLDSGSAHFRSLRSAPAAQRAKAIAFVEQIWELTYALQRRIRLPPVDLPGFTGGEVEPDPSRTPAAAAAALREHWRLGTGPIPHLVRTIENHGLIVTLTPFAGTATGQIDAFSVCRLPRPVIVLTPDRADDVYRHRFTAAHELGHLLLHSDAVPGDPIQERHADAFAAALLTPTESIRPQLPARADLDALHRLSHIWGVSIDSLLYRCREIGTITDTTYRRAAARLRQHRAAGHYTPEPVTGYPGELPVLLDRAFTLATEHGLTATALATELAWPLPRLRYLLNPADTRPDLRLVEP